MARPKSFDRGEALDTALQLFWAQGYEATSMTDLRKAMGIGRQSLYDTFGDKDALFAEALGHYVRAGEEATRCFLANGDGVEAVRRLVTSTAARLASEAPASGCMIVNTCVERAPHDAAVAGQVRSGLLMAQEQMEAALRRAQSDGTLRADADPSALAALMATVMHGLAVRARGGAPGQELLDIAKTALSALD